MNSTRCPLDVSRETAAKLEIYVRELLKWQRALNLVSAASLPDLWNRHIDDCLQIGEAEPHAQTWCDLGSGAGLPGLIIAASERQPHVILIESDSRKCAFLRSTSAHMGVSVVVHEQRIERFQEAQARTVAAVTARGLAPLSRLLDLSQRWLLDGATGVFPKGKTFRSELTQAHECWRFDSAVIPSRTHPDAAVIRVRHFEGSRF